MRVNLVTIPYKQWSKIHDVDTRHEFVAYEVIHPSLRRSLASSIYSNFLHLLSIQTKDLCPLKSHKRRFHLGAPVHIQQCCQSRVHTDLTYMNSLKDKIQLSDDPRHSPPPSVNPATPMPGARPPMTITPVESSAIYT